MKHLMTLLTLGLCLALGQARAAGPQDQCAAQAAEKKLAGAAKASFEKKCMADATAGAPGMHNAACEKSAADKNLHGAARGSHIKKCMADAAEAKK